jgi:hypothetical protein
VPRQSITLRTCKVLRSNCPSKTPRGLACTDSLRIRCEFLSRDSVSIC